MVWDIFGRRVVPSMETTLGSGEIAYYVLAPAACRHRPPWLRRQARAGSGGPTPLGGRSRSLALGDRRSRGAFRVLGAATAPRAERRRPHAACPRAIRSMDRRCSGIGVGVGRHQEVSLVKWIVALVCVAGLALAAYGEAAKAPLNLAIIWHQHQPLYWNRLTAEYELPWVRIHAVQEYIDSARISAEFPGVHVAFNLQPSLLWQLEDYATITPEEAARGGLLRHRRRRRQPPAVGLGPGPRSRVALRGGSRPPPGSGLLDQRLHADRHGRPIRTTTRDMRN